MSENKIKVGRTYTFFSIGLTQLKYKVSTVSKDIVYLSISDLSSEKPLLNCQHLGTYIS